MRWAGQTRLKTYILTLTAASLAAACSITTQSTPTPQSPQQPGTAGTSVQVSIPAGAAQFGPAAYGANPFTIRAGINVTWINNDTMPHTVTADDGSFDSGTIAPGQSYSHVFNAVGTYTYYCTIHGRAAMSGVVQVGTNTIAQ